MIPEQFYHIYNRGNNGQEIFLNRENYIFFLQKIRSHLLDHVEIIAYCLMPTHFHLLAYSKADLVSEKFGNDLKIMLRSYTRAINKGENRTGSLFQQHTKVKPLEDNYDIASRSMVGSEDYPFICFHYIHQNPVRAGLVKYMEQWEMSSFQDYAGMRSGTLCAKKIAFELLDIPKLPLEFIDQSYQVRII